MKQLFIIFTATIIMSVVFVGQNGFALSSPIQSPLQQPLPTETFHQLPNIPAPVQNTTPNGIITPLPTQIAPKHQCTQSLCDTIFSDCVDAYVSFNKDAPEEMIMTDDKIKLECGARYNYCLEDCGIQKLQQNNTVKQDITVSSPDSGKQEHKTNVGIPIFVIQRRWPVPSFVNPGNTSCVYFTDGTKYCK